MRGSKPGASSWCILDLLSTAAQKLPLNARVTASSRLISFPSARSRSRSSWPKPSPNCCSGRCSSAISRGSVLGAFNRSCGLRRAQQPGSLCWLAFGDSDIGETFQLVSHGGKVAQFLPAGDRLPVQGFRFYPVSLPPMDMGQLAARN